MKKFDRVRELDDIVKRAKECNYKVDMSPFKSGYNGVYLIHEERKTLTYINATNGRFGVSVNISKDGEEEEYDLIANHKSTDLDNVEWYAELLNIIYC